MQNKEGRLKEIFRKAMRRTKGKPLVQLGILGVFVVIGGVLAVTGTDTPVTLNANGDMEIHYVDIGQGDATHIEVNGMNILIDAGPRSGADNLVEHLKSDGVKTIDYFIVTHVHEDHQGGAVKVLDNFEVKNYLAPDSTHTTKTYQNSMDAVANEGLKQTVIDDNTSIELGSGTVLEVLDDGTYKGENLNDYSPVILLTHGETNFLFTGDAEKGVEEKVLASNKTMPDIDVMQMGHHGSSTSNSKAFLDAIDAELGIISLAKDNKYGHPHRETLSYLDNNQNMEYLRTDTEGTIKVKSNGKQVEVVSNNSKSLSNLN